MENKMEGKKRADDELGVWSQKNMKKGVVNTALNGSCKYTNELLLCALISNRILPHSSDQSPQLKQITVYLCDNIL